MTPVSSASHRDLAGSMRASGLDGARVAIVAGSGLGDRAARIEGARRVPFADLAGMPCSGVAGHIGAFARGRMGGVEVLVQLGRAHLYEGLAAAVVARERRT